MLVLSRKAGQQVIIGDGSIQVKVLKVDGDDVSIGFAAPDSVSIDREEIYLKKLLSTTSFQQ